MKIAALLLALCVPLNAQNPRGAGGPSGPALPKGTVAKRDIVYVPGGGERQKLDVFFPEKSDKPFPLVVWIHGGAWRAGSKDRCPALPLLEDGFVVASVTYRFSQDAVFPAQIEDCKAALRWLRAHAPEFHIDPTRVGVWGASAGGHLVAMLGVAGEVSKWDVGENLDQNSRVQAVVDWFGPANLLTMGVQSAPGSRLDHDAPDSPESRLVGGAVQSKKEAAAAASPVTYVDRTDAPILMMHGDKDPLVPHAQSVEFLAVLKKAGVDSELKTLEGAGHGDGGFRSADSFAAVRAFFKKRLQ